MKVRTFESNTEVDNVWEVLIPSGKSITISYNEETEKYLIPEDSEWIYVV